MKNVKINLKNAASKFMLFVFAAAVVINFNACNKNDDPGTDPSENYEAGQIPGLGGFEGDLTGTPFHLPDGVELTEDITGAVNQSNYWDWSSFYAYGYSPRLFINKDGSIETKPVTLRAQNEDEPIIHYHGSGRGYVDLLLPLRNTRSTPVTITFPAATILASKAGDCQNGVLIKKVTVTIPANSIYRLCLSFYCGNAHKSAAGGYDIYILGVVSNAGPLLELCELVKNKKINLEEFSRTSYDDYATYQSQTSSLQSIVWSVTDYDGIDEDDIAYIKSLPNS